MPEGEGRREPGRESSPRCACKHEKGGQEAATAKTKALRRRMLKEPKKGTKGKAARSARYVVTEKSPPTPAPVQLPPPAPTAVCGCVKKKCMGTLLFRLTSAQRVKPELHLRPQWTFTRGNTRNAQQRDNETRAILLPSDLLISSGFTAHSRRHEQGSRVAAFP